MHYGGHFGIMTITFKLKININKNLLVNFTVLSSENGATAIYTSYL